MIVPLSNILRTTRVLPMALVLVSLVAGCASVDTAPFTEFSSSLQPLRAASDAQAAAAAKASLHELIDSVDRDEISPADLQLDFDGTDAFASSYGFAQTEPMFVKLTRLRQGLSALNDAMIAYARALVVLAGAGEEGDILPTQDQFDQMAWDLNAKAGTAATALGVNFEAGDQALLSTAAVQLFKLYIENERREELVAAINKVQPRVDEFSVAARQAVNLFAQLVKKVYSKEVRSLITASPPDAAAILALNYTTQVMLATLKSLSESYGAIPAAHRDLAEAASMRAVIFAGLSALKNEANRLQGLANELAEANAAASPTR